MPIPGRDARTQLICPMPGEPYISSLTRNLFIVSQVPVPYMRREPSAEKSAPRSIGDKTLAPAAEPAK